MKKTTVNRHSIGVKWIKKYPTLARFTVPFLMVFLVPAVLFFTVKETFTTVLPTVWCDFKSETNLLWRIMRYGIEKE